jgi:hypothetical protein
MEQIELTALQKAKKKYYEKNKKDPSYIEHRRANCTKYYNKIKNEIEFKQKISNYKRQYYINKKEQLLEIIV